MAHADQPEEKGALLRLRSNNRWLCNNYSDALEDTLLALKILGVTVNAAPTRKEADLMFEQVKNEILAVGLTEILAIPRTTDPRIELIVALLNDAGLWRTKVLDLLVELNSTFKASTHIGVQRLRSRS